MNFSYLTIFLLLILFFLYIKLESNNKLRIFTLGIIVILMVHEAYMYIGLNKTENFQVRIGNMDINDLSVEPVNFNTLLNNVIINNRKFNLLTNDLIEVDKFIDFMPINNSVLAYNNKINISSKTAFLFDDNGTIIKTIQISEKNDKYDCAGLYYNGYAMFAGGIDYENNNISNKINFYNIENDTLSLVELTKGRYKMSCGQDEDYIVLAFGINDSNNISKRIDYFSKSNTNLLDGSNWETLSCPYPGKLYSKVLIHENKIYIVGGFDGTGFKNDIYIYNFDRGKWSKININLFKSVNRLQAEILDFDSKKRLYIMSSNNTQKEFYHKKLVFSLTNIPQKYNYSIESNTVGLKKNDVEKLSTEEIFTSEKSNTGDYNYSYLGDYIPKIYDEISNSLETSHTISMWLYIDGSNIEKTKMIMGDYELCTGESFSEKNYACLILHKNRILPCIKLDKKLLIKNNDEIPEVHFNKWFHYVATFKNPDVDYSTNSQPTTEGFTSCVFSESLSYVEEQVSKTDTDTETENITNNPEFFSYMNGKKTVTNLSTNLVFNEDTKSLSVDGFESFNQEREYANNTMIANLKIFNGLLDIGTIYDLMTNENNFYSNSEPELAYMDINNKSIRLLDYNLSGKNGLMQSFNKQNLKIISTNMEFDYDIKKGSDYNSEKLDDNKNMFDLIRLNDGMVKISLNNNLINFTKIPMTILSDSLTCEPGTFISNNNCIECPVGTYTNSKNMFKCKDCPKGLSTNNKTGSSKCSPTNEFMEKNTNIVLDKNVIDYLREKASSYQSAMEKVNETKTQVTNMEKNLELLNKNII